METNNKPPFSKRFVMRTTLARMHEQCSFSIDKTITRLKEDWSEEKRNEINDTLETLRELKSIIRNWKYKYTGDEND